MGKDFYDHSPAARAFLDTASSKLEFDFKNLLFDHNILLDKSEYTQMAIVLNSLMAFLAFDERVKNFKANCVLGHSLGEFSALGVAGGLDFYEAIKLVRMRGRFMQEACSSYEAGMLVVLGMDDNSVNDICEDLRALGSKIWPANYNCDKQIVLAGLKKDLEASIPSFKEAGAKRAMLLNMSVASHCPLQESAAKALSPLLGEFVHDAKIPVYSNVTAKPYQEAMQACELLQKQLVSPVLYKQSIHAAQKHVSGFIEFGSSVLRGLNKKITSLPTLSLQSMADLDTITKDLL